jgi:hypothetical protein
MRFIALIWLGVVLAWASAPSKPKPPALKSRPHHSSRADRNPGAWDPGHTLANPFGLPPWLRRRPAPPPPRH